jgi:hypothetical protein
LASPESSTTTDPDNAVPLCRPHHDEVTFKEPAWAYGLGILIHSWEKTPPADLAVIRRNLLVGLPLIPASHEAMKRGLILGVARVVYHGRLE